MPTQTLEDIRSNGLLQCLFQPIYSLCEQQILGYEALSRGPEDSPLFTPLQLFAAARETAQLCELDSFCRQLACSRFRQLKLQGLLFLNVSPESLLDPEHKPGRTLKLIDSLGLCPSNVVIELTEHAPGQDFALLEKALRHYRAMGFRIALDDLGSGFSSLRLWSELRPDYVKIDRHFIQGIHQDAVKREFVSSIVKMAGASRAQVIVEGVEQREELTTLINLGVDLVQGFLLCKPQAFPPLQAGDILTQLLPPADTPPVAEKPLLSLLLQQSGVNQGAQINDVLQRFHQQANLNSLVVLDSKGRPVGIVHRQPLAEAMLRPFAQDLLGRKPITRLMQEDYLAVEHDQSLQLVSRLLTSRARQRIDEDFIILEQGLYLGLGRVIDVLHLITGQQLQQARHANPLTLLPGNVPIRQCLTRLLAQKRAVVICYVDIDHFKPFNDLYGYAKGDEVLLCLAQCLRQTVDLSCDFVGHIGGDDFLLALASADWRTRLNSLQMDFQRESRRFYRAEHLLNGCFTALNRKGRWEEYPLLSLSLGVVTLTSAACSQFEEDELAALASEAKRQAKAIPGYSLHILRAG